MNLGFIAASHDVVLTTVGHANLSNTYNFHAGARHFNNSDVGGAFAGVLHNEGASAIERYASVIVGLELMKPAHKVKRARMGVLAATSAMISKAAWEELGGFDERYETGGEDTALAAKMLANGYGVIREPAMTVHHSHGLGVIDSIKQLHGWNQTLKAPQKLDRDELLARRPDLLANFDKDTSKTH
jgi:GT2 family glycosyltransferase